jgi:hypothetical protein
MSVCPSFRTELSSHWTFIKFDIFRKSVEKIQVSLKSDNNNGTLHEDLCTFMIVSRSILLRMKNISDKSCRENQNTHFISITFSRKSCRLWDNVEKYGTARQATDDNTIRRMRMRFACWITTATTVTRTRLNITSYVHYLSCYNLNAMQYLHR